jgi:DNA-binding MarR family transcriptional regulator
MTRPAPRKRSANGQAGLPLADRPGFLVRRLHQIHVALFAEECAPFGITPVQFSVLTALERVAPMDQVSLAGEVGIDRANCTDVLGRLEDRGLILRVANPADSRAKLCELTPAGRRLLARLAPAAQRAHDRTIAALPKAERDAFLRSLTRLVEANNALGRAKLRLR